jgi:hypothetical protein
MTLITDTWRQLVQRRLWPIALLLVAALVGVPMLLAKNPNPAPIAPPPSGTGSAAPADDPLTAKPVVATASASDAGRHVLGARKDPFAPAIKAKPTPAPNQTKTSGSSTQGTGGSSSPATGGGSSPVTPGVGVPPVAAPKPKTYPADSLTVRFGTGNGDPKTVLKKGEALPVDTTGDATPLLVYLGLANHGKEALFLVDASVQADGDGHCDTGAASSCETLHLRAGDTEFLDVTDDTGKVTGQYELDLLAIHASKQAQAATRGIAARAQSALASAASAGRSAINAGVAALLASL